VPPSAPSGKYMPDAGADVADEGDEKILGEKAGGSQ
jgi:hypothetical protein